MWYTNGLGQNIALLSPFKLTVFYLIYLIVICLFLQVNLPDQPTITSADSSITVSFTSYDNLGSMMNMDSDFSSSVLSVNVIGVEKVYMY